MAQKHNTSQKRKAKIDVLIILTVAAILLLTIAILRPLLKEPRQVASRVVCGANLSGIAKAISVYVSNDPHGRLPPADKWCDLLVQYDICTPRLFVCRESDAIIGESIFAINKNVAGKSIYRIPKDVVLLFETDFGKDRRGRQELLKNRPWYKTMPYGQPETRVYKDRWNQAGGPEILTTRNHNGKACLVAFLDGHLESVEKKHLRNLKWK